MFLRYRNLHTVAVAHAVLGTCIAISIPTPVIRNMQVGRGYLTYACAPARLVRSAASGAPPPMHSSRSLQP